MDTSGGRGPGGPDAPGTGGRPPGRSRRAGRWLPTAAFLLALAPYYAFLWPGGRVLPSGDYTCYQEPVHRFVRSELLRGRFPLWDPWIGCGTPLHASQQAAVTYPLLTPFLLLASSANAGLRLALVVHAALGYWGQFRLARRLGLGRPASSFAALVFTLSGFPMGHLLAGHVCLLLGYGLLPWFFLALLGFLGRPGPRTAAGLAAMAALLLLVGHPQVPYYALLFGGLWGACSLVGGDAAEHRGRAIGWGLAAGVVAALLASVQWLPWAELFRDGRSYSARGTPEFALIGSLDRWELCLLLVPDVLGNPYAGIEAPSQPSWYYHEKGCYMGLLSLGLIAVGLARRGRGRRGRRGPLAALCGLALVVAMGGNTPLFRPMCLAVPGLSQFYCPGRVAALACLFAPLLAASGFEALLRREPLGEGLGRWRRAAVVAAVLLACLAAPRVYRRLSRGAYAEFARTSLAGPLLRGGALAAASLAAAAGARRLSRRSPEAGAALLIGVVFLDLYASQGRLVRLSDPRDADGGAIPAPPSPGRFTIEPPGADALRFSLLVRLLGEGPLSGVVTNEGGVLPSSLVRLHTRLIDPATRETFERLAACNLVYRTAERAWAPLSGGLGRVRLAGELDLRQLHEEGRFPGLRPASGSVEVLGETPLEMRLRVRTDRPSLVIVADGYDRGWLATVDGRPSPVLRVHGSFRAVEVPSGGHRVEFSYAPSSFRRGLAGTLVGVVLLGLMGVPRPRASGDGSRGPRRLE